MAEEAKVPAGMIPAEQANPPSSDAPAPSSSTGEANGDPKEISKSAGEQLRTVERQVADDRPAKKEAKRLERLAKAALKTAAPSSSAPKKEKKEKEKKEAVVQEEWVNTTPKGEKKDVSGDLPSTGYDPIRVEAAWYDWWNQKGFFKPKYKADGEPLDKGVFSIVFPPPNVTGNLHIGHALTASLEDAMIRWSVLLTRQHYVSADVVS